MAADPTVNAFFSLHVPGDLVEALVGLQQEQRERVDPQQREHIHITLGFLHNADAARLADAAALLSGGDWPAPVIRPTGEVRHGSWRLQKDPSYHYDGDLVQAQEQVRLGVEHTDELAAIYSGLIDRLGIAEDGFWPHVTLGLARHDFPLAAVTNMPLPTRGSTAPSVDLQQELTATDFRILVRKELG
ncbi:hypothetical protein [Streptomyces phytophilus]|uniref:hypothetical protein n=1 Tax=Streptomyces phytophilus TaxID=722715 RepID=UPI0015F0F769|nr:hypothetical protein [Streptomyces phytophilus]